MIRPELKTSFASWEERELILSWARSQGINKGSDLLRVALFEYIRRKLPKEPVTVPQQKLKDIVDWTIE